MPSIAVVSAGIPHPSRGASLVVFHAYVDSLLRAGHSVHHAILLPPSTETPQRTAKSYWLSLSQTDGSTYNFHQISPLLYPQRFGVRRSVEKLSRVVSEVQAFQPDAVIAFDLDAALVAREIEAKCRIAWLGDIHFRSSWYNFLYGFREKPTTIRWLPCAMAQRAAWRRRYAEILPAFDKIVVSSKSSEADLAALGLNATYFPYPWPENGARYRLDRSCLPPKPRFLLFGNLTALGSRSCFHALFDKVIPAMRRLWGKDGFEVAVAGHAQMRDWVERKIKITPELRFLGFVVDLGREIAISHAVLVPLDVPVGNRSRILTAMAHGGLVIAHRNAALGNDALVSGENALLFRTTREMIAHMATAVTEPREAERLIASGRETYDEFFAPARATGRFCDLVSEELKRVS